MVKDLDLPYEDSLEPIEESSAPKKALPIFPLVRMVIRRWPIIIGVATVATGAAWFSSLSDVPVYAGSFRLLVEPVTSEGRISEPTALSRSVGGGWNQDAGLDYSTQLEVLQSPQVLEDVYEEVKQKHPEFLYVDLLQGLKVERIGGQFNDTRTSILDISYQGSEPSIVQDVLDEVSKKYLRYSLEDRKTRVSEGVKFIEEQLPTLQTRVDALEGELQALQQTYDLLDPVTQGSDLYTKLNEVGALQLQTQQDLQEARTLYTSLQRQLQLTSDEAIAVSAISEDIQYQQLLTNINEIETQLATETTRWSEEAPPVQRLRQRQANLYSLLGQRGQQVLGRSVQLDSNTQLTTFQDSVRLGLVSQLVETTNKLQILEVRSQVLAQNRALVEQQVQQFPDVARRYNELQRQLEISTQTLNQLLTQREVLRVTAAQTQVPWELLSEPAIPLDATGNPMAAPMDGSNKLLAGGVLGIILATAMSFLLERKQDIYYDAEDIKDLIAVPRLGVIPVCTDGDPSMQLVAIAHPNGQVAELSQNAFDFQDAFDTLYTNLKFLNQSAPVRSMVVCSVNAGDGKTTTALHLARTAAAAGQRVLLVDANLRSPQIHRKLSLPNAHGLTDILYHKASPNEVIQAAPEIKNLDVLTAGVINSGASRLVASPQMKSLMGKLKPAYDLVIYDSPNLEDAADANFVAANSDGILLIIALMQTSRSKVSQNVKKLHDYNLPILGTVANRSQKIPQKDIPHWEVDDERSEDLLLPASENQPVYSSMSMKRAAFIKDHEI